MSHDPRIDSSWARIMERAVKVLLGPPLFVQAGGTTPRKKELTGGDEVGRGVQEERKEKKRKERTFFMCNG
jgi:hypothetical protein